MNTSSVTARVTAILTIEPQYSFDIWETLADEAVRQSDVIDELHALVGEGVAKLVDVQQGQPWGYALVAQAVAS